MSLLKEITILREWFLITVNSRYCGHSRDRDLVSVLARVRNSGVREKKNRKCICWIYDKSRSHNRGLWLLDKRKYLVTQIR